MYYDTPIVIEREGCIVSILFMSYRILDSDMRLSLSFRGDASQLSQITINKNEEILVSLDTPFFEDGNNISVSMEGVTKHDTISIDILYADGEVKTVYKKAKVCYPIFIGLLSKWMISDSLTYKQLYALTKLDIEHQPNQLLSYTSDDKEITYHSSTKETEGKRIVLLLPLSYPSLRYITVNGNKIDTNAFICAPITLHIKGKDIPYALYIQKDKLGMFLHGINIKVYLS